jgi:hypothetical protein
MKLEHLRRHRAAATCPHETLDGLPDMAPPDRRFAPPRETWPELASALPALCGDDEAGRRARWRFVLLANDECLLASERISQLSTGALWSQLAPDFWTTAWSAATREMAPTDPPFVWTWPLAMHLSGRSAREIRPQDIQAVYGLYDLSRHFDERPLPFGKCIRIPEAEFLAVSNIPDYCDPEDHYLPAWFDRVVSAWELYLLRDGEARE